MCIWCLNFLTDKGKKREREVKGGWDRKRRVGREEKEGEKRGRRGETVDETERERGGGGGGEGGERM